MFWTEKFLCYTLYYTNPIDGWLYFYNIQHSKVQEVFVKEEKTTLFLKIQLKAASRICT